MKGKANPLPRAPGEDCRPFLKWAGGKRQILPQLLARVPPRFGRYFEPFLGGGALFFALRPAAATLGDSNDRLIRTYLGVRSSVDRVVALLAEYPYEAEFFYRMRAVEVDRLEDAEVAAWFIYLNKTGYNGLYRVNRANRFNVPFGRYENPTICDATNLAACARALAKAELVAEDFESVVRRAEPGDFVYFDPPYVPLSTSSSFTSYTAGGFGAAEQLRLRDVALALKRRGVHVLLSNSSAPFVRDLYAPDFEVSEVSAVRAVNSSAGGRGAITELVMA